jgi:hypothetical protein
MYLFWGRVLLFIASFTLFCHIIDFAIKLLLFVFCAIVALWHPICVCKMLSIAGSYYTPFLQLLTVTSHVP